jgi:hypothetical protein
VVAIVHTIVGFEVLPRLQSKTRAPERSRHVSIAAANGEDNCIIAGLTITISEIAVFERTSAPARHGGQRAQFPPVSPRRTEIQRNIYIVDDSRRGGKISTGSSLACPQGKNKKDIKSSQMPCT